VATSLKVNINSNLVSRELRPASLGEDPATTPATRLATAVAVVVVWSDSSLVAY